MGRWWFACCLWLGSSLCLGAPVPPGTYAGKLLEEVRRANPQVLGAAISATAPKAAAAVVVAATEPATVGAPADPADLAASRNGATTAVPNAAGDRLEVRLPLRDVSGDTVGALRLSYTYRAGADRTALERNAEGIRDRLHRRISHAGNLFDPYPYEPGAPSNTYAQQLVDEFIDRYPDIEVLAIHVTPPDSDYNIIAGSNIGRLGKKADNDDMRCVFTGKPNLEVNSTGKRFESELQLHDRAGNVIGAVGIVVAYKNGDDKRALHARAEKIAAELEKRIPDSASLFGPAKTVATNPVAAIAMARSTGAASPAASGASSDSVLVLQGRTELPGYSGDFDHFAVDLQGNRLFLAAEDHGTLVLQPADGEAVDLGDGLLEDARAEAVAIPRERCCFLDRDRHALQQAKRFPTRDAFLGRGRLAFRQVTGQKHVGIELGIDPPDALVIQRSELARLHLPGNDCACLFACALQCPGVIDHPLTVKKSPPENTGGLHMKGSA